MLVSWIPPPLNIPILDAPDDVRLVGRPKHQLDLITLILLWACQQEIESASSFLRAFPVQKDSFTQPEYCGVFCNPGLKPLLIKFGMIFKRYGFVLRVVQPSHRAAGRPVMASRKPSSSPSRCAMRSRS